MSLTDFQRRLGVSQDGKWGPITERAANDALNLAPVPPHPKLSADIIAAAQKSERAWGVPASVTLAQFALESAWGTKLAAPFNPFGIKAKPGEPQTVANTREERPDGSSYYINAGFRKFSSFAEAFDAHGKLLGTAGVYAKARATLPDPDAFADALTGVYATAGNYGTVLKSIMRSQGLYRYEVGGKA